MLRVRLNQHLPLQFWDRITAFVSTGGGLNRAHVLWLEWALINRAKAVEGVRLENGNAGSKPNLSEAEEADVEGFLQEILAFCR